MHAIPIVNAIPYPLDSLKWSFQVTDSMMEQRVFLSKTSEAFRIDSLYSDFNGVTMLKVIAVDDGNLSDTLDIEFNIDQINDAPVVNISLDSLLIKFDLIK